MTLRRLTEISESDKAGIIEGLKEILQLHEEILFGLLYGSMADPGIAGKYGDMDIALYVTPDSLRTAEYVLESRIEAEVYRALRERGLNFPPPEIIIMNTAPNHFLVKMFKRPYIFLKGEEGPITDFIEEIGSRSTENYHLRMESLREVATD